MSGVILLVLRVAMAAALYAFLGWALWTLWRDLKKSGESSSAAQAPMLTLAQGDGGSPQTYRFVKPQVIIGRDPANDCVLEDKTISAQHTRLSYHHGQWWVEDLRSRNGTFLNQERIEAPLVIAGGDRLRCGSVDLEISIGGQDSSV